MDAAIKKIAETLRQKEFERQKMSDALRRVKELAEMKEIDGSQTLINEGICTKIPKKTASENVVGVDGGLLVKSYHGLDLIVTRAVGVNFRYVDGKLQDHNYHPSGSPSPDIISFTTSISSHELSMFPNIYRTQKELQIALECAKKYAPGTLVLHGSVVPYPSKPQEGSVARPAYNKMISMYRELYDFCDKNGIKLCGVVEDSRSARFSEIITKLILPEFAEQSVGGEIRDTALLYDALDHGERTFAFKYYSNPNEHPVLSDLGEWNKQIYSFYMKSAEFDRPIKVDFLGKGDVSGRAQELASILFWMSGFNRAYGIPTVLIEADCRAKLKEEEMDFIYDRIMREAGSGPLSMRLRREMRPF